METINVVVVDDSDADRYLANRVLTRHERIAEVVEYCNGAEALDSYGDDNRFYKPAGSVSPPVLLLLDINMPIVNGFEFLAALAQLRSEGKFDPDEACVLVMLTSSGYFGDRDKALAFDFVSEYVEKPITREKLETILAQLYPAAA